MDGVAGNLALCDGLAHKISLALYGVVDMSEPKQQPGQLENVWFEAAEQACNAVMAAVAYVREPSALTNLPRRTNFDPPISASSAKIQSPECLAPNGTAPAKARQAIRFQQDLASPPK
jgi:hypothetical protein